MIRTLADAGFTAHLEVARYFLADALQSHGPPKFSGCITADEKLDWHGYGAASMLMNHLWPGVPVLQVARGCRCCRWQGTQQVEAELAQWRRLFVAATALTVPVFLLTVVFPLLPGTRAVLLHHVLGFPLAPLLKWLFTTPVQVYARTQPPSNAVTVFASICGARSKCEDLAEDGRREMCVTISHAHGLARFLQFWVAWRFHVGAYKSLKRGQANMDVLVSLGTNASYIFSVITLVCDRQHQVSCCCHMH